MTKRREVRFVSGRITWMQLRNGPSDGHRGRVVVLKNVDHREQSIEYEGVRIERRQRLVTGIAPFGLLQVTQKNLRDG